MEMIQLKDAVTKGSSNISLNKIKDDKGTYPLFSAKGFHKNISFYHQEEEYLAIIKDGAGIGRISIHPPKSSCVGTMQYLIPKKGFDIRFIRYCLLSIDFTKYSQGATIPHIYFKDYKSELLPKLSFEEQLELVSELDQAFEAIDQAIVNTEKNIDNVEELRKSLLNSLLSNPDGKDYPLKEICTLINGRAYKKPELLEDGKYRVLRVGNLFTSKHWYYSNLELDEKKYIDKGDLIYAWSASFGARIWNEEKVIYHYHIWKVIPNRKLVSKEFLYLLFEWDKERIKSSHGAGTTMIHVSKKSMENRVLPIPNLERQDKIVNDFNLTNFNLIVLDNHLNKKLKQLKMLKSSILEQAFKE